MFPRLYNYISLCSIELKSISVNRTNNLLPLATNIVSQLLIKKVPQLNFICTHNSRRSHLAHIWAKVMANHLQLPTLDCYSGGTEATEIHPNTIGTLIRAGFQVSLESNSPKYNPIYLVKYSEDYPPERCFSKVYNKVPNPYKDYIAILTCSEADDACPIVSGANTRHSITYEDPKGFDGTPKENAAYDERSKQIASEMLYLMTKIEEDLAK
tara:strand:- start:4298 stop:4933 length:636 start_codon:yes stop_codon:yes gene_type:complete